MAPTRRPASAHEWAFNTYYKTRNKREVERLSGIQDDRGNFPCGPNGAIVYLTILDWSRADYKCTWGCPFHNWDELTKQRDAVINNTLDISRQLNTFPSKVDEFSPPVLSDQAAYDPVETANKVNYDAKLAESKGEVLKLPERIMRPEAERITHWEYLYAKVFYDATGLPIDYSALKNTDFQKKIGDENIRTLFAMGYRAKSLESAINMLSTIQDQINALKEAQEGKVPVKTHSSEKEKPKVVAKVSDRETLRKLKREMEKIQSGEKMQAIVDVIDANTAKPVESRVVDGVVTDPPKVENVGTEPGRSTDA
jgi:hypothetical protein